MSRTAQKRAAILDAARDRFLDQGYVGTSMDDVAVSAGVSKQTIYKQFTDKESLFTTIVLDAIATSEADTRATLAALPAETDFVAGLRDFAYRHAVGILDPTVLALRRTVIGEALRFPELARTWWERGPQAGHRTLAAVLGEASERGHLGRLDDPMLAAQHLNWLVLSIPMNTALFLGDSADLSEEELRAITDEAVRVFLAAYGP